MGKKKEKKHAEKESVSHEPTGSGRLPGSKYVVTEAEINDCDDSDALKDFMREASTKARTGCCGKHGLIHNWKYIVKVRGRANGHEVEDAQTIYKDAKQMNAELKELMGASYDKRLGSIDEIEKKFNFRFAEISSKDELMFTSNLLLFLGGPPDELDPPNPNHFVFREETEAGKVPHIPTNMLRFNRKKLIVNVYDKERPSFASKIKEQKVTFIEVPTPGQIDSWNLKELRHQCKKRGFRAPPYCFKTNTNKSIIINKSKSVGVPSKFTLLQNGLKKVKRCKEDQLKELFGLLAEDPRFRDGQPVVIPSYFDRTCHNVPCIFLFWLFWILMIAVAAIAYVSGDPLRLVRPTDYNGHTCGDITHKDTTGKAWLFYPQLAEDSLRVMQQGNLQCAETYAGCFYGVCMEKCPEQGDIICNYETDAALATMSTADATAKRRLYASSPSIPGIIKPATQKCWYASIGQIGLAYRCFPFSRKSETTTYNCVTMVSTVNGTVRIKSAIDTKNMNDGQVEIALAKCSGTIESTSVETQMYQSGTQSLSGMLNGMLAYTEQIFSDISNSWWALIMIGPVLSGILSFLFICLMMYFASLLIWTTIFACQVASVVLCLAMFYQAGHLSRIDTFLASQNSTLAKYATKLSSFAQSYQQETAGTGNTGSLGGISEADSEWYWSVAAYVSLVLAVIIVVTPCCLKHSISLCIALVKEAARSVRSTKMVLFYPFFGYFWLFVVFVYWLITSTYIVSSSVTEDDVASLTTTLGNAWDQAKANNSNFDMTFVKDVRDAFTSAMVDLKSQAANVSYTKVDFSAAQGNNVVRAAFVFNLFGWLWTNEFIKAIGMITISGAIALDYWVPHEDKRFRPQNPVISSFFRTLRYHLGSAIFGSLIVAFVRFIRYVMMYIDEKTAELQKDSRAVKLLMAIVHCVLWCFEKCVRFLTESAYIIIAIEGTSFLSSAWRAFKLIFSNSLRIATTQVMSFIILTLAQVGISMFCTILMWIVIKNAPQFQPDGAFWVDSPVAPCILVFVSAGIITMTFMSVYHMAISTILLSFCLDEDKYKKGMYKHKTDSMGNSDRRMFCIVNQKYGLITLTSKNAREEIKKHRNRRAAMERQAEASVNVGRSTDPTGPRTAIAPARSSEGNPVLETTTETTTLFSLPQPERVARPTLERPREGDSSRRFSSPARRHRTPDRRRQP